VHELVVLQLFHLPAEIARQPFEEVALSFDDVLEHLGELLFVRAAALALLGAFARFAGLTALERLLTLLARLTTLSLLAALALLRTLTGLLSALLAFPVVAELLHAACGFIGAALAAFALLATLAGLTVLLRTAETVVQGAALFLEDLLQALLDVFESGRE